MKPTIGSDARIASFASTLAPLLASLVIGCSGNVDGSLMDMGPAAAAGGAQPVQMAAATTPVEHASLGAPATLAAPADEASDVPAMPPPYQGVPLRWTLDGKSSFLSLITTKQTDIAEVHTFERFSGSVDQNGTAMLAIDVASIATNVDLRDQRLREILFEAASFPEASASFTLDMASVDAMAVGTSGELPVSASFSFHGTSKMLETSLWVSRLSASEVVVQTKKPIVLNALDYNLGAGLETLIGLAGIDSISTAVPVEFMLTFHTADVATAEGDVPEAVAAP
jgi:hypothetical protein